MLKQFLNEIKSKKINAIKILSILAILGIMTTTVSAGMLIYSNGNGDYDIENIYSINKTTEANDYTPAASKSTFENPISFDCGYNNSGSDSTPCANSNESNDNPNNHTSEPPIPSSQNPSGAVSEVNNSPISQTPAAGWVDNQVIITMPNPPTYYGGRIALSKIDLSEVGAKGIVIVGGGRTPEGEGVTIFLVTLDRHCADNVLRVANILKQRDDILDAGPNQFMSPRPRV